MSIEQYGEQDHQLDLLAEISKIYAEQALRTAEAQRIAKARAEDYVEHLRLGDEPAQAETAAILFDIYPQLKKSATEGVIMAQPEHDLSAFAEAVLLAAKQNGRQYTGLHGHISVAVGPDQELDQVRSAFGLD